MLSTIGTLFVSASLFITGGHLLSTDLKLHHYADDDYKNILLIKNKATTTKNCTKHSMLEDIKKVKSFRNNPDGGEMVTTYKITKAKDHNPEALPKS